MGSASSSVSGHYECPAAQGFTSLRPTEWDSSDEEDQDSVSKDESTPDLAVQLKDAIKADAVEKLCFLLEEKANVNHEYEFGLTPLHFAALHGSLRATKVLLCESADVSAVTSDDQRLTARAIADAEEHSDIVELILDMSERASKAVTLNIYDLGRNCKIKAVNTVLSTLGTGAFHVGVEVYGTEYSFGYNESHSLSGICGCAPRRCSDHTYRESLPMGETPLNERSVEKLIEELAPQWVGSHYNLLTCNCTHFCNVFCRWLAVGPIPLWVMSLSAAGATLNHGVAKLNDSVNATANSAAENILYNMHQLRTLDTQLSISETLSMSAEYNQRKLRELDEQLKISETISLSADYNHRKLREFDDKLKISETITMSADYNQRKLREWGCQLQIFPGKAISK